MRDRIKGFTGAALVAASLALASCGPKPHNVIIFVADGLRSQMVTPETAPALAEVRAEGVDFRNSHSVYPTLTTVNASSIATGHFPGDHGDFGNAPVHRRGPAGLPGQWRDPLPGRR